jgi:hypothetical protein
MKAIPCANCGYPMTLTRVSNDNRNPGQQILTCPQCRLIEIRAPEPSPSRQGSLPRDHGASQQSSARRP